MCIRDRRGVVHLGGGYVDPSALVAEKVAALKRDVDEAVVRVVGLDVEAPEIVILFGSARRTARKSRESMATLRSWRRAGCVGERAVDHSHVLGKHDRHPLRTAPAAETKYTSSQGEVSRA